MTHKGKQEQINMGARKDPKKRARPTRMHRVATMIDTTDVAIEVGLEEYLEEKHRAK